MMRILCAAALIIAAVAFAQRPAQAYEAPWCAVVDTGMGGNYWDCQYSSLEACIPHVLAGNRGFCNQNPAYRGVEPRRPAPRHQPRRRY